MNEQPRRILALDLGEVRIGLALSDPLRITAQPLGTLPRQGTRKDLSTVVALVHQHDVGAVVVGNPLLLSGEAGARSRASEQFAHKLSRELEGVAVELWDERLTTAQVERVLIEGDVSRRRRKKVIDSLAAVLILQSYLDASSARKEGRGT